MTTSETFTTSANDNTNPYASATGAYLRLLQTRAKFLKLAPTLTSNDELARCQASIARLEALMRQVEPYLQIRA